jgi:hypothetical protein
MNVKRYFNEGKSPKIQIYSGLSNVLIKNENGILNCKFNRTKTINSISNFYNLNNPYYVLLATGDFDGGKLKEMQYNIIIIKILIFFKFKQDIPQYHSQKLTSDSLINFNQNGMFNVSEKKLVMVKAHGSFFFKGRSFIKFRKTIHSKFKRLYYDYCLVVLCYNRNIICKVRLFFIL